MIIYDYSRDGRQIVKKEIIHEYKERLGYASDLKKKPRSTERVGQDWDMTKCK